MGRVWSPAEGAAPSRKSSETRSPLPRRTSLRLAQSSSNANANYNNAPAKDSRERINNPYSFTSPNDPRFRSVEVAIPLTKTRLSYGSSTPSGSEDILGDGPDEYNTPATSVAVTPPESDVNVSRKQINATSRARELQLSAMSLNTKSGLKRASDGIPDNTSTDTHSDADLARMLQIQEYQKPPQKRQKVSATVKQIPWEVQDSTEGDDAALALDESSELEEEDTVKDWQKSRKTRAPTLSRPDTIIADSEDPNSTSDDEFNEQDDIYEDDTEATDSSSAPATEDEPLSLHRSRNGNARNSNIREPARRRPRRRPRAQASSSRLSRTSPTSARSGMSSRALRERRKLEKQHPVIPRMWEDLKKDSIIMPVAAAQPPGISRRLKPFQLEGLSWMIQQEKTQYKGGLLGDEMGMGKTIQAVSLLMSDYPVGKPSLVVVPPVALMQWQSEIKEYTNNQLKVLVYHNSNSKLKHLSKGDLEAYDVIMISYSGLESIHRKEWKGWSRNDEIVKEDSIIHSIHYHRLILDEAHSIKQRTTSVARACFALRANYKWCLSGTPVQNRIGEFFSLLRFLEIRPFACYFCKQCDCQQLHWSQDAEKRCAYCKHSGFSHVSIFNQEILNPITERNNPAARREALSKLRLITDRIMLRRMKRDHTASMELPPKRVILHNEFFGEIERDFSRSIMTNSTRQFDRYVSRGVMLNNYANIFGLIMQMRQVANHPDLILKKHAESGQNVLVCSVCDEPAEEAIRSRCHHEFCRRCAKDYFGSFDANTVVDCPRCHIPLSIDFEQPDIEQEEEHVKKNSIINRIRMEDWTSSTKIEMLVYELYKLRSKKQTHKSIVFSQFTSMLQLVEWRLRRAGFNTVMLDGTMTPAQRQKSIEYFMNNVDVEVFLVSLKAGGVALNLTEASRVFIVDPWWNPAAEWQSADRCHRIGQRRPCVITRLCIEDSVESRIVLLQEKKANLINGTINKDQGEALEKLTPEDMQFLFRGS
ncbi:repair protein RAD16 [Aspergillus sclerotialis]|uniref:Repair protein RAD16 n=1 Tax=Aspergillus sclerotialis TaxID=2070753 RepID=A0A3A2ZJB4_9EURO|nr:repair protein RAD16 [Aspergillus sclerotialis]